VTGGVKAAHVRADLREDGERRQGADAGDRCEQTDQIGKSGLVGPGLLIHAIDPSIDFAIDNPDRRVERVPLAEMQLEKEAVMVGQPPMQRIVQFLRRAFTLASARAANLRGSRTPATIASIMRRPLAPMVSLSTESRRMFASVSVFWMR